MSLAIIATFIAIAATSWYMYETNRVSYYLWYSTIVLLLWLYAPLATIATAILILKAMPHPLAKLGIIGCIVLLFLLVPFWNMNAGVLPIRHVLKECVSFRAYDKLYSISLAGDGESQASVRMLHTKWLVNAPKPNVPSDDQIYVRLNHDDLIYRSLYFNIPFDLPLYQLDYYSADGVIGDPRTEEFVYAPPQFRHWMNSVTTEREPRQVGAP